MSSPRPLNEGIMTTTAELNYSTSKNNITDSLLLHVTESGGIYDGDGHCHDFDSRSEEHTSELQSQFRISYAVFCLKKKKKKFFFFFF